MGKGTIWAALLLTAVIGAAEVVAVGTAYWLEGPAKIPLRLEESSLSNFVH